MRQAGGISLIHRAGSGAPGENSQLGTVVAEFPGDHGGFTALPDHFGRALGQVLNEAT